MPSQPDDSSKASLLLGGSPCGQNSPCAGSECDSSEACGQLGAECCDRHDDHGECHDHDHDHDSNGGRVVDSALIGSTISASPEIDAALPKQIRIKAWQDSSTLAARPDRDSLPPTPDRIHRRWDRFVRLVGNEGTRRLLSSHVTVFGLGGVGSYLVEALARSAVGRLTLVDFDDVCLTNVNRQLQAFPGTVGQSKAALLAERVRAIHPEAWVDPVQAFYDASTSDALLTPRPDFVVDAIDNVTSKVLLLETCRRQNIPVISITGAGARLDPTQVRVADLGQTKVDPLARVLRKELSKRGLVESGDFGIPVVYSEEDVLQPEVPEWDVEKGFQCICPHRADSPHACEKRRTIYGTATFMTAAFAMAAAAFVVRQLSQSLLSQRAD